MLIANSLLVPAWATWEHFRDLEARGLMMYGQMTAGSWIYIGTQGILQGTYETLAEAGRRHFGGTLEGRLVLTAGLGGMGGAQPLAITMAGGVGLIVEVDPQRIERRIETGYLDRWTGSLDEALSLVRDAIARRAPLSVGLLGNASEVLPELLRRGVRADLVTDQTSAHDPLNGYVPGGMTLAEALRLRREKPRDYVEAVHAIDGRALPGHGGDAEARLDRLRLRQQPARSGAEGRVHRGFLLSRIRPRLHPLPVLPGEGSLPLGRAFGGPEGHPSHRPRHPRDLSR